VVIYSFTLAHGSLLIGVLLSLESAVTWATFSVLFRKSRAEDSASLVGSQYLFGSITFIVLSIPFHNLDPTPRFFVDFLYLAIPGGAVQLYVWNSLLKVETVARMSTITFAIPALTVAIQAVETLSLPDPLSVFGALVMFFGIYVANRGRTQETKPFAESQNKVIRPD